MENNMNKKTEMFQGFRGRLLAASIAGALVVGGLGAFAMTQPGGQNQKAPQQHAPQKPQPAPLAVAPHPSTPRMIETGAPFSFADLVERVSPAVVTITVEEQVKEQANIDAEQIPEPFRDFFNQFG
jgi:serine protease Do